jgi:hypothetical protein
MPISLELLKQIAENKPNLSSLNLSQMSLTDDDVQLLCQALANNNFVKELNL